MCIIRQNINETMTEQDKSASNINSVCSMQDQRISCVSHNITHFCVKQCHNVKYSNSYQTINKETRYILISNTIHIRQYINMKLRLFLAIKPRITFNCTYLIIMHKQSLTQILIMHQCTLF